MKPPCRFRAATTHRRIADCNRRDRFGSVFRCELHGECTLIRLNRNITPCSQCEDYEPAEDSLIRLQLPTHASDAASGPGIDPSGRV